jgi:hypothetical protein
MFPPSDKERPPCRGAYHPSCGDPPTAIAGRRPYPLDCLQRSGSLKIVGGAWDKKHARAKTSFRRAGNGAARISSPFKDFRGMRGSVRAVRRPGNGGFRRGNGGRWVKWRRIRGLEGWLSELPRSVRWDCDFLRQLHLVDSQQQESVGIDQISTVGLRRGCHGPQASPTGGE